MSIKPTRRLPWRVAQVTHNQPETDTAHTIGLNVAGWPGHQAGQHVDVKLTAEDGYSSQRSYSLGRPSDGERIELTVERVVDGEVSPYLTGMSTGDEIEVRGPFGGWFVWHPEVLTPALLIGGGSGIVPLMAMLRQRVDATSGADVDVVYAARSPAAMYYTDELKLLDREFRWLRLTLAYTRSIPPHVTRPAGRLAPKDLALPGWMPGVDVRIYVCGPTGFVESVTAILIGQGHRPSTIRTERFGPSA
ncbi:ferredoxin reductase [Mycobacterium sp. AT1]|uniref:ferredoxin reductase n=1 Tax=Mycobacterium sp. AT1 TaxID=1961706 RepID=UPI0009AC73F9|nr:ferredoxin reductase [Mycobacterium sp. AT1]OPX06834.1 oxidoreductase [Mycobacterium sp. AT1]